MGGLKRVLDVLGIAVELKQAKLYYRSFLSSITCQACGLEEVRFTVILYLCPGISLDYFLSL